MLKEGTDHFELTKQEPKVDVCEKRYIFNAHLLDPSQLFDAKGKCPEYELPEGLAVAARAKRNADDREMAVLANLLPAAPIKTGRDGGTNEAFAGRVPVSDDGRYLAGTAPSGGEVVTGSTPQSASTPVPQANPRRPGESRASAYASNGSRARNTQEAGDREPDEAQQPAQQPPSAPLPGAVPIRSSGGFSYR
jgi:hypothetical protein